VRSDLPGAVLCAGAMLLVGASVAVMPLLDGYPVLAGQALRYSGAFLLLGLLALRVPRAGARPTRAEWLRLAALAAVGLAGFNLALMATVGRATPAVVGAVVGAAPVALVLAGAATARRAPQRGALIGALLVCTGVALGQSGGSATLRGLVWSLVALACEVAFTLLAGPLLPRLGPLLVSTYACGLAAPMLVVMAVVSGGPVVPGPTAAELFALVWLVVVTTSVGFVMWYAGVARLGAARAGLFTGLIPLGALLMSAVSGREVSQVVVLGTLLAGAGLVVGMAPHTRTRLRV
jgi:drug/metabolite transporter (DMT)-like permease